jgi:hypothetical protein
MNPNPPHSIESAKVTISEPTFQAIRQAFEGLRYGQVIVTVQDGRVMQIDRTERHRLPSDKLSS